MGNVELGLWLFIVACVNRLIETWAVGWTVVRDPVARKQPWLYLVRDLLGFAVWVASYTSAKAAWRSSNYELRKDKIVLREKTQHAK